MYTEAIQGTLEFDLWTSSLELEGYVKFISGGQYVSSQMEIKVGSHCHIIGENTSLVGSCSFPHSQTSFPICGIRKVTNPLPSGSDLKRRVCDASITATPAYWPQISESEMASDGGSKVTGAWGVTQRQCLALIDPSYWLPRLHSNQIHLLK